MAAAEPTVATIAQPRIITVPIVYGGKNLVVRPWSMGLQDELMPIISQLLDDWTAWQKENPEAEFSLGTLVLTCHGRVREICQRTVRDELKDQNLDWDELAGDDLLGIAQAIWSTSILRPGGGGLLGKAIATMGPGLIQILAAVADRSDTSPPSTSPPPENPTNESGDSSTPSSSTT